MSRGREGLKVKRMNGRRKKTREMDVERQKYVEISTLVCGLISLIQT
jgi:hypothetical protein